MEAFGIVALILRAAMIGALSVVIYRQVMLSRLRAPQEVGRLRRLLLTLTIAMVAINVLALVQNIIAVYWLDDFQVTIGGVGDVLYITSRLVGDIINASIIYLIYKEVEL